MKEYHSFLHHKRHKALHKAVAVMDKKTNIQCNRIHHLEDTMIMYGVYNSNTLKDLIDTVHRMQNFTTGMKRHLQENYMTGWNCILMTKVYITML